MRSLATVVMMVEPPGEPSTKRSFPGRVGAGVEPGLVERGT